MKQCFSFLRSQKFKSLKIQNWRIQNLLRFLMLEKIEDEFIVVKLMAPKTLRWVSSEVISARAILVSTTPDKGRDWPVLGYIN